eukprot:331403-Pelagomonas_calceolata.AAC.5
MQAKQVAEAFWILWCASKATQSLARCYFLWPPLNAGKAGRGGILGSYSVQAKHSLNAGTAGCRGMAESHGMQA